jgi:cell wall-associated protease
MRSETRVITILFQLCKDYQSIAHFKSDSCYSIEIDKLMNFVQWGANCYFRAHLYQQPKKMKIKHTLLFAALLATVTVVSAQQASTKIPENWHLLDPATDSVQGVSVEKAYTLLKNKPSRTVIVAVIDSGIDIDHEDLKDVIWKNEKEIAGNGIDDDNNGYVDDVYGWSFLGGKEGDVKSETLELTREYARLKSKYATLTADKVSKKDESEFKYWESVKKDFETASQRAIQQSSFIKQLYSNLLKANDTLKIVLQTDVVTYDKVASADLSNPGIKSAKETLDFFYSRFGKDVVLEEILSQLKKSADDAESDCKHNPDCNSRAVVGDDVLNIKEKYYGNNNVKGPDSFHGTHVAGIIAANRNNEVGIKGIADNVRIMVVRAVPDGDERDKDVANAIIYAVDNGAQIINMSFGKPLSPDKSVVDKAIKYAESKNVLLIHAAGNDGSNNDQKPAYPTRFYSNGKEAKNWIEVGASAWGTGERLAASFSNYGKKTVNLFAPGVRIYSTVPDNGYQNAQGTSMASPVTAGVAAMIMSYFPHLSATQVKDVLLQSTRKFDGLKVNKPGSKDQVEFNELSSSGGLINAYEAVRLAMTLKATPSKK